MLVHIHLKKDGLTALAVTPSLLFRRYLCHNIPILTNTQFSRIFYFMRYSSSGSITKLVSEFGTDRAGVTAILVGKMLGVYR